MSASYGDIVRAQFAKQRGAVWALRLLGALFLCATYAPVIALNIPFFVRESGGSSMPWFAALFNPKDDPKEVIIDFLGTRVFDASGLQAIDSLADKYKRLGKNLRLRHLSPDCRALLDKAGGLMELSVIDDPQYGVAVDYGARFDGEEPKTDTGISSSLSR